MANVHIIRSAEFDPRVKTYWLVSGMFICVITLVGIPLLVLWVPLGLYLTGRYLERMACELTPKALKVRKGILVRVEKTIPLEKITDMAMVQGPVMRHFGIRKMTVETAGQSGQGALVSLLGIVEAEAFREAVLAQRDKIADARADRETGGESDAAGATLTDIRDSLLRIEAAMAEVLARKRL